MSVALVAFGLAALVAAVAWRPHGWSPALGALVAVLLPGLGGLVGVDDVVAALEAQWRAYVTLAAVMTMTSAAERMGLLHRLAALIEPRTRGPVKHAFRVTFVLATLVAALLSNDAAILLLTPTVLALLRTVYPRRYPTFQVPFAMAVFAAAGVAPLVISNPMNLIFADHVGIGFNRYALTMVPVALVGWITTYHVLAWVFRDALADTSPALGEWPDRPARMGLAERVVLVAALGVLLGYPLLSALDVPLWPVAATGGLVCAGVGIAAGHPLRAVGAGIAWPVFPFLTCVFVLALALDRVGVVGWLRELYATSDAPIATIGVTSSIGSALLNNHPMSVLNAFALGETAAERQLSFAALVGGNLGPRLLPVGSLASLIWYDLLRKHQVTVSLWTFVRTGAILTVPTLAVSLLALWLLGFVS